MQPVAALPPPAYLGIPPAHAEPQEDAANEIGSGVEEEVRPRRPEPLYMGCPGRRRLGAAHS